MERTVAHPLTGPAYVKGAKPGDLLEIEHLDIVPDATAGRASRRASRFRTLPSP
jgi:acetamidase/formamidase